MHALLIYLPSIFYVLTTSLSTILVHGVGYEMSPALSLFICLFITILLFHILMLKKLGLMYSQAIANFKLTLLVNILILVIWVSFFYGLSLILPFTFILIYFSIPVIIVDLKSAILDKNMSSLAIALSILFLILFYIVSEFYYYNFGAGEILGCALAVLSGVGGYFYRHVSYRLTKAMGGSSLSVLAIRSHLLLLFCLAILLVLYVKGMPSVMPVWDIQLLIQLGFVLFFTFLLPFILNQKGITNANPDSHSIITGLTPMATFVAVYFFNIKYHPLFIEGLLISITVTFLLVVPRLLSYLRKRRPHE